MFLLIRQTEYPVYKHTNLSSASKTFHHIPRQRYIMGLHNKTKMFLVPFFMDIFVAFAFLTAAVQRAITFIELPSINPMSFSLRGLK